LWQIIVVDAERVKQEIVLHIRSRALQDTLILGSALPRTNQTPKAGIVLVIDVTWQTEHQFLSCHSAILDQGQRMQHIGNCKQGDT
jgi:hypothetical protein